MKITTLKKKLESLGIETNLEIKARHSQITETFTGYNVKLTATNGNRDFLATSYVELHEIADDQTAADVATCEYYSVKPSREESDPMTDYCAWSFRDTIKELDNVFAKAVA
jgi:hypothetical protein